MSTIRLEYPHHVPAALAKDKIDHLLARLKEKSPYFDGVEPTWSDDGTECRFSGEGFSGLAVIDEQLLRIQLELSGILTMFQSMVESKLQEMVSQEFGGADG